MEILHQGPAFAMKPLVTKAALLSRNSHLWFQFVISLIPYYAFWRASQTEKGPFLPLLCKTAELSPEDEAERTETNTRRDKFSYFGNHQGNDQGNDASEDEQSDDGETDDSDSNGGQGSDDSGGEDNDDGSDEWDKDESDEEEDEEESDYSSSSEEDLDDRPLFTHARKVYRGNIFHAFRHEYRKSMALMVDVTDEDFHEEGMVFKYRLYRYGHRGREHKLTAYPTEGRMHCSCNFFKYFGLLCSHALLVLRCLRIDKIPDYHLLEWMRKDYVVEENAYRLKSKRRRLLSANRTTKGVNKASKDDISIVYLERKEDIYKYVSRIDYDLLRHASKAQASAILYTFLPKEQPKATRDDIYTAYHEKPKCPEVNSSLFNAPILSHARDIYIPEIFSLFLEEYRKSEYLETIVDPTTNFGTKCTYVEYEVYTPGHLDRKCDVYVDWADSTVNCSCGKFESVGILCCHVLAVYDCLGNVGIPAQYILDKFVRDEKLPQIARFKEIWAELRKVMKLAAVSEKAADALERGLVELKADLLGKLDKAGETSGGSYK